MLDCWLDKSNLPEDFAAVRPDRIMTTMQALTEYTVPDARSHQLAGYLHLLAPPVKTSQEKQTLPFSAHKP